MSSFRRAFYSPRDMETTEGLEELFARLREPANILITAHTNPDGDAIGSACGLRGFLDSFGHTLRALAPTRVPGYLQWIAGQDDIIISEYDPEPAKKAVEEADLIFCLDFGALSRLRSLEEPVRAAKAPKINIDHHREPEDFARYYLRDVGASSTAELVYRFIDKMGELNRLTPNIANALMTGLITDTGSFQHGNTTPAALRVTADLVERGGNMAYVNYSLFGNMSENRARMTGYSLYERLKVLPDFRTAYIGIPQRMYKNFEIKPGDTEGLVNFALSVEGANLGILMIEYPDHVRMSFRSTGQFSAAELAGHFNGGGHYNAAGGRSPLTLEETETRLLTFLQQYRDQLNYTPFSGEGKA